MILNGLDSCDHIVTYRRACRITALEIRRMMPPDVVPIGFSNELERSNPQSRVNLGQKDVHLLVFGWFNAEVSEVDVDVDEIILS